MKKTSLLLAVGALLYGASGSYGTQNTVPLLGVSTNVNNEVCL